MLTYGNLYADLSIYYDRFCRNIAYAQQCAYAQRLFDIFAESDGKHYFDLACGTGQHLKVMAEAGFIVTGLDNSAAMLEQAAQRCPTATLLLADMAEFGQEAEFDLITCFLYSLHYSQPLDRLYQVLSRAYAALKTGGVLLFDLVDKNGIVNHTGITTYLDETNQRFEFSSEWHYSGTGDAMQLRLGIKRLSHDDGGLKCEHWQDTHAMSAVSIVDIQAYLTDIGFEVYVMERDFDAVTSWAGKTFNVVVAAVKK